MKLSHLAERSLAPTPWSEGEKIPWHEPGFSRRMLAEHLSQAHDLASRRFEIIDRQVAWIHEHVLAAKPARILDLGCGPGLYAERLVALGHEVVGVDISPASIAHAKEHVGEATFLEADIRQVELEGLDSFALAMLLFGEANAFRRRDLETVLSNAAAALGSGGALILEPHTFAAVRRIGCQAPAWYAAQQGLFADDPYVCLHESFWDNASAAATERWWVIDSNTAEVTRHVGTLQAYGEDDYRSLLENAGFEGIAQHDGLGVAQEDLFALVARKSS